MHLYPVPKNISRSRARISRAGVYVTLPGQGTSARLISAARRFCRLHGLRLTFGQPDEAEVFLALSRPSTRRRGPEPDQAYELNIQKQPVSITAADDAGLYYGLGTLQQIMAQYPDTLPRLTIMDAPDFPDRGIMLDVSRCKVPTMATLLSLIDRFSMLKINQLQLYIEHTFAFSRHETVWQDASPLTAEEILELRDYCADRFIDLVPNLNSFGHFERWLRHREYRHLAECPDGFRHPLSGVISSHGSTLKPGRESLRFLQGLYDEYLPLFDSRYFNVGGDEPWELGQGWSAEKCRRKGTGEVYVDFMAKINQLVQKRGRETMFWSDIVLKYPEALDSLPQQIIALNWGYEADHPFAQECEQVATRRIPYYVCPGTSSWNALTGRLNNASRNLIAAAREGIKFNARGYLITDWGDHGHHQYLPFSYPGFTLGACAAWHHDGCRSLDLVDAISRTFGQDIPACAVPCLLDLGRMAEAVPPVRNATLFNQLLFWPMTDEPVAARELDDTGLEACQERFSCLSETIRALPGGTYREEMNNAVAMASHGLDRLALYRGIHRRRRLMARALDRIIDRHRNLWLTRNRPGGLDESLAHLHRSSAALQR